MLAMSVERQIPRGCTVRRCELWSYAGICSWLRCPAALISAFLVITACGCPAVAETLQQALTDAYLINPVLNSERARLRATDEQVALAKAGLRPFISGSGDVGFMHTRTVTPRVPPTTIGTPPNQIVIPGSGGVSNATTHPRGVAVQLTQPLFEGFQNLNAIRGAKSTVQAARDSLRSVEQTVLLDAVTAYVNVVRDAAIVRLRENDVTVLTEQLKATKDRFDVGEVTRTDVAQAEARRSEALSTLAAAQANLKTSNAAYEQIIGHPPGKLETPPSIRGLLPSSLDDAMTLGDGENPLILAAVYQEEASLYAVQQIMGELLPTATFEAQYQNRFDQSRTLKELETTTLTA